MLMQNFSCIVSGFVHPLVGHSLLHRDSGHGPSLSLHSLHAPPEIQSALEGEHKWEFDVIRLEKVTNKR